MNVNQKRTLVLSCAHALRGDGLELFVRSLRQSHYEDRICLLVSDMGEEEKALLRRYQVELLPFQKAYLPCRSRYLLDLAIRLSSPRQFLRKRCELAVSWMPIVSSRFLQFHTLLSDWGRDCDQIVMLDCRDTIFQGNPATLPFGEKVTIVRETKSKTVGNCPWNSVMQRKAYGAAVFREMSDLPVLCAGATFGRREAVLNYLERVGEALTEFATTEFFDQPAHNYLAYKDAGFMEILPDANPSILHMNSMTPEEFGVREGTVVANRNGEVPVVVHQYDRHPALHEALRQKIRAGL